MSRRKNTKDGSLSLHIYNQEIANTFRYLAKLKGMTTQKLATKIIEEYIKENLTLKG